MLLSVNPPPVYLGAAALQSQAAGVARQVLEYTEAATGRARDDSSNKMRYECRICLSLQTSKFNLMTHFLGAHNFGDEGLVHQLDAFIAPYHQKQAPNTYLCKLCRKVLRGTTASKLIIHFLSMHLVKHD